MRIALLKIMTKKEKIILEDFKGYIDYSLKEDKDFRWVLANLGHDIQGLLNNFKFFSPRTNGFSKL